MYLLGAGRWYSKSFMRNNSFLDREDKAEWASNLPKQEQEESESNENLTLVQNLRMPKNSVIKVSNKEQNELNFKIK